MEEIWVPTTAIFTISIEVPCRTACWVAAIVDLAFRSVHCRSQYKRFTTLLDYEFMRLCLYVWLKCFTLWRHDTRHASTQPHVNRPAKAHTTATARRSPTDLCGLFPQVPQVFRLRFLFLFCILILSRLLRILPNISVSSVCLFYMLATPLIWSLIDLLQELLFLQTKSFWITPSRYILTAADHSHTWYNTCDWITGTHIWMCCGHFGLHTTRSSCEMFPFCCLFLLCVETQRKCATKENKHKIKIFS